MNVLLYVSYFFAVVFIAVSSGCGGGGLPGGDQTINISTSQDQDQTNTQTQNEPDLSCSHACTTELDGGSNLTETCEGGATSVLAAFGTFGDCAAQLVPSSSETSANEN